jgi:hypothetical protein
MELKLVKQYGVNKDTFKPETWYYVRSGCVTVKAFLEEEKAKSYYEALKTFYQTHGTTEPVETVIESITLNKTT